MPTPANDSPLEVACPQCGKKVIVEPQVLIALFVANVANCLTWALGRKSHIALQVNPPWTSGLRYPACSSR